jgi:hypothetical protein
MTGLVLIRAEGLMRWLVALLCLGAAGCASSEPPAPTPDPPTPAVIATTAAAVAAESKIPAPLEVSPVRAGHPLAPGDWIVCLKSGAPDQRLRYAMFFKKDYLSSRIAISVDGCGGETYAALAPPTAAPK